MKLSALASFAFAIPAFALSDHMANLMRRDSFAFSGLNLKFQTNSLTPTPSAIKNSTCDALLTTIADGVLKACSKVPVPTTLDNIRPYIQDYITNVCKDSSCYNYPAQYASQINSTCPAGYVGDILMNGVRSPISVDAIKQDLEVKSQEKVDNLVMCYSESGKYCFVEMFVAATKNDKAALCGSCTRNLIKKGETAQEVSANGKPVSLNIGVLKSEVSNVCGATFLTSNASRGINAQLVSSAFFLMFLSMIL